jgi:transposase
LDLGVRKISFCEVASGRVVQRRTASDLATLEDTLGDKSPPATVAIEACREAWHAHAVLNSWGHHVSLVDTTRARQWGIGNHGRKTHRVDAEVLAFAVERGHIPLAHLLSPARQQLRLELGVRRALVETHSHYITTVRGIVRAHGGRLPSCSTDDFLTHLAKATLDDSTRALVTPLEDVLVQVERQIVEGDLRLEELCRAEPAIERRTTAPGVGLIVAAVFVSVLDEAKRFRHAHEVEAYLGLVPSESSSGGRRRIGAITKHGNAYARAMLVQAAWRILQPHPSDDPLRRWGRDVARRRGRCIAAVAVARRLVGVLWAMWRHDTVCDPARVGKASARGLAEQAQDLQVRAAAMVRAAIKTQLRQRRTRKPAERSSVSTQFTMPFRALTSAPSANGRASKPTADERDGNEDGRPPGAPTPRNSVRHRFRFESPTASELPGPHCPAR